MIPRSLYGCPGNWGITSGPGVEWLSVVVLENRANPEALANGPAANDTVTGAASPVRMRRTLGRKSGSEEEES